MDTVAALRAFVGLDYHDSVVQVCVLNSAGAVLGHGRVENQLAAIVDYVERVRAGRLVSGVAIEACCGAANLAEQLRAQGWEVELAHAGLCSKMKQHPDKSDFTDAHLLADLVRVGRHIREVEARLEASTADDPIVQKLLAEKGLGLVTAVTMRAEIGSFDRFQSGKQLARSCAVTPKHVSSGKRQADGGLIQAGNLHLRTMLVEAAHRLARFAPQWKKLKDRLKAKGKPANVAAAAGANRWIRRLDWEMRTAA